MTSQRPAVALVTRMGPVAITKKIQCLDMKTFIFIPLLLTSAAPHRNIFGPPGDNDNGGFPSPWWHPNRNQFTGMGSPLDLDMGIGPFSPPGFGPGNGNKHEAGVFGPPGGGNNIPWHPWSQITTTKSSATGSVIDACVAACRGSEEEDPVCGTNDVTYPNIEMLECAKACGVPVYVKGKSRCSRSPFIPPPNPSPNSTPDNGNNISRDSSNRGNENNSAAAFAFQICTKNCQVTAEYSPVCGTDGVTYSNFGRLQCAQDCGKNVQISKISECSAPVNRGIGDAISFCIQTCSETGPNIPVCGTDNVTYYNDGTLECARNCGHNVQISRRTACSITTDPDGLRVTTSSPNGNGNGNWNGNGGNGNWNGNEGGNTNGGNGNSNSGNGSWNGNGGGNNNGGNGNNGNNNGGISNGGIDNGNPSMTEVIACVQRCPITLESNPVCGTDGVTYSNPGKLLCAQFCGVNVRAQKFAPCQGDWVPTPQPAICPTLPTIPLNPEQSCINSCAVSPEFKPVCGTDGLTYINLASLLCKQRCGVDVKLHKQSACEEVFTNKPTAQTPPVWSNTDRPTQPTVVTPTPTPIRACLDQCKFTENKPVCGSNGETYANLATLQCAKRCGINVDLKNNSPCTSLPIDGSKDPENNLGFTIPNDVLASIFPEDFPVTPPTKVTPTTEDDESYEVDQRFDH